MDWIYDYIIRETVDEYMSLDDDDKYMIPFITSQLALPNWPAFVRKQKKRCDLLILAWEN